MIENPTPAPGHYNNTVVEPVNNVPLKRISWSAIFAGVIISMGTPPQ